MTLRCLPMGTIKVFSVVIAVVLCGLELPCCSALKCFKCDMCEDDPGTIESCSLAQDVCMTILLGPAKMKRCAYRTFCFDGDVELSMTDSVKTTINEWTDHFIGGKKENTMSQVVQCCRHDYCNAASVTTPATALLMLLVPVVVGHLLQ